LQKTETLWAPIEQAYRGVHRAAFILSNHEESSATQVRTEYEALLQEMVDHQATVGSLACAIEQFLNVTKSFAPGLFHSYDVPDLPPPTMIWNSVSDRCVTMSDAPSDDAAPFLDWWCAALFVWLLRLPRGSPALPPRHYGCGITNCGVRSGERLTYRQEARRRQFRFRKDPLAYLTQIEARLLQT